MNNDPSHTKSNRRIENPNAEFHPDFVRKIEQFTESVALPAADGDFDRIRAMLGRSRESMPVAVRQEVLGLLEGVKLLALAEPENRFEGVFGKLSFVVMNLRFSPEEGATISFGVNNCDGEGPGSTDYSLDDLLIELVPVNAVPIPVAELLEDTLFFDGLMPDEEYVVKASSRVK